MSESHGFWEGDVWIEIADWAECKPPKAEGFHRSRHSNGNVAAEWTIVKGVHDGVARKWHESGSLASEVTYVAGELHGSVRTWHDNGVLAKEVPFVSGKAHGLVRKWNREGKLLGEYTMTHGRGVEFTWNEDGSLQLEFEQLSESAARGVVYDDLGKPHHTFLWNGKSISKKKFFERLIKEAAAE